MTHDHANEHGIARHDRAFLVSVVLNIAFVAFEVSFGLWSHSMALVADAGHNVSDVLGLVLAWGASALARRAPSRLRTYGFRRATILAALLNGALLLLATGAIILESVRRLFDPGAVDGTTVMVVAGLGVAINGGSALLLRRGGERDLNVRGAFLHLAADAAVSLGVVAAGALVLYTRWCLVDPIVSLALSGAIVVTAWRLLRRSANLALDAVPEHIDVDAVRVYLDTLPGVVEVHDLHVWAMSTTEDALTAHLVMDAGSCGPRFLRDVCSVLHDRFGVEHSTLQVEPPEGDPCRLAAEDTV